MKRLCPLENQSVHHIYTKSIYHFKIFTCDEEYQRMLQLMQFYQYDGHEISFSHFIEKINNPADFPMALERCVQQKTKLVDRLAYCLMPTHVHFVLQQLTDKGIETFIRRLLNAYSRYFNLRHNRRGPLWQSRFGNRLIENEEYLHKVIDYVLTNPVKDNLVTSPSQWKYTSATPGVAEVISICPSPLIPLRPF